MKEDKLKNIIESLKSENPSNKAKFFHNTAIDVLFIFQTRRFSDVELFTKFLKFYSKQYRLKVDGLGSKYSTDEEFYKNDLRIR